jgi:hypothetical protein
MVFKPECLRNNFQTNQTMKLQISKAEVERLMASKYGLSTTDDIEITGLEPSQLVAKQDDEYISIPKPEYADDEFQGDSDNWLRVDIFNNWSTLSGNPRLKFRRRKPTSSSNSAAPGVPLVANKQSPEMVTIKFERLWECVAYLLRLNNFVPEFCINKDRLRAELAAIERRNNEKD